jgi:hypothetical protein
MLQIDVSRGEKVILPRENCTGSANSRGIWTGGTGFYQDGQDHLVNPETNPVNPVPAFCSQSSALLAGGRFDTRPHLRLPRLITIEFAVRRAGWFRR